MILIETHECIPLAEVGLFVQRCLIDGVRSVFVTRNADRLTCTVRVHRE